MTKQEILHFGSTSFFSGVTAALPTQTLLCTKWKNNNINSHLFARLSVIDSLDCFNTDPNKVTVWVNSAQTRQLNSYITRQSITANAEEVTRLKTCSIFL